MLNLEVPDQNIRDNWMKCLHSVVMKRTDMKSADSESKKTNVQQSVVPAQPNSATPASTSSSSSTSVSASQPLPLPTRANSSPASNATLNNRTINFSDPTDFFSMISKIGEGSYGAVFKALDHRDRRHVAIKVLQFQGRDSAKLRKEIKILKQCHSDFIVGYKGAFQKGANVWIVME